MAFKSKDHNGAPLCFDFSPDRQMLAVGYEDDSFIVYAIDVYSQASRIDYCPVVRGIGHKNFINALKFDTYFYKHHQ